MALPDRIHVELARDVGKSIEERREITSGIEKRNKQKDKLKEWFAEDIGHASARRRSRQGGIASFRTVAGAKRALPLQRRPHQSVISSSSDDNSVQVDHILPWGRFGDEIPSTTRRCAQPRANQDKRGRTPRRMVPCRNDRMPAEWDAFVARVVFHSIYERIQENEKLQAEKRRRGSGKLFL